MLFNSYEYIILFLPVAAVVFYSFLWLASLRATVIWLAAASFYFYSGWSAKYVPLLAGSIIFNFVIGSTMERCQHLSRILLPIGIVGDLGLMAYFKYTNFLIDQTNQLFNVNIDALNIILPIGISFFTFTQIAYLIDVSRGIVGHYDFGRYTLFVTFFPHLLAGPILHHRQMMPQFGRRMTINWYAYSIAFGILLFAIGLFKKVVLADTAAPYANAVFDAVGRGEPIGGFAAWCGALAYTVQIYFDFSGYTDMALGSARLFGIKLPLNFNTPYAATSIIEFWRRWHMTLSRFLRDYLYIPLGGNRKGPARRYTNLLATMVLGGLWHGAGWGFAAWGFLHGIYLIINHVWRATGVRPMPMFMGPIVGFMLTFIATVIGWVFFRAPNLQAALRMLGAMFGMGATDSREFFEKLVQSWQALSGAGFSHTMITLVGLRTISFPQMAVFGDFSGVLLLPVFILIAVLGPNSQALVMWCMRKAGGPGVLNRFVAAGVAAMLGLATFITLGRLNNVKEFLYFQF